MLKISNEQFSSISEFFSITARIVHVLTLLYNTMILSFEHEIPTKYLVLIT